MRRAVVALMIIAAGVAAGAAAGLTLRSDPAPSSTEVPRRHQSESPPAQVPTPASAASPRAVPTDAETIPSGRKVLLAWTPGSLPDGFAKAVRRASHVGTVTVVRGGVVDLVSSTAADGSRVDRHRNGWAVPLDALAVQPLQYARLVPASAAPTVRRLRPGTALLGSTSAQLRRLTKGAVVTLRGGHRLTVAGVVDDSLIGAAEIVVGPADADAIGLRTARFLMAEYSGNRADVEERIRSRAPPGVTLRVRGPGETPYLRHGDAVLPQALVKAAFGEFAYRPPHRGRGFGQQQSWIERNLVTQRVPILGEVFCHRITASALHGAMTQLRNEGLARLVDADAFGGCWNPRLIAVDGGLSRHAWGAAVDLNARTNPTGRSSAQDPRLVDIMRHWGFTWGGEWLVPDPMHFEYVRAPRSR